ncbi:MAG: hypothetical protein GWN00_16195, partial [Aliifodinibius sp.]|nr:hypothetical protein [Fodinibius sp.]NIY26289.1 hypothetical protein [Fodinibius sp.]
DWDSTFQSDYSGSTYDEWRVWYDLTAIERNYDITLTYSPSDDPLTTNTQYTFTATSTMNGLGLEVINVIYWDGGQIATDYSETNGVYQFTLISSYGGLHNLTIAIWDGSPPTYQYSESWVYTFSFPSTTTTPTSPTVVTTTSNLIIGGIPIILMILFPTFIFWRFSGENIFGAMIG